MEKLVRRRFGKFGAVHRDNGEGQPACKVQAHAGQEWVPVELLPEMKGTYQCQRRLCFGRDNDS
jgi:hypothetical protein